MPNNYLSVLNKHIIQVENKNVGLKVGGGTSIPLPPPNQKSVCGGVSPPLPTPVIYIGVGSGGGGGGKGGYVPPTFFIGGQWYVCAPPYF